eukprot:3833220-Heterocapsa_arctica.AAC.1
MHAASPHPSSNKKSYRGSKRNSHEDKTGENCQSGIQEQNIVCLRWSPSSSYERQSRRLDRSRENRGNNKYSLAGSEKHLTQGRINRQSRLSNASWAISLSEVRDTSTISPNGARTKVSNFTTLKEMEIVFTHAL